ncbi:MAG: hypothetical protein ACI9NT_001922 [Bacteroidia bacterium]|jgi:hypothetical protein
MLQRFIVLAVIVGAAYWYWQGPYQAKINPQYTTILDQNDEKIASCVKSKLYLAGTRGVGPDASAAAEGCAGEFNLYRHNGRWHNYELSRPN